MSRWDVPIEALSSKWAKELRRLRAENAKLRELFRCAVGAYEGVVEMLPDSYTKTVAERAVSDFREHMQELGIEVNE